MKRFLISSIQSLIKKSPSLYRLFAYRFKAKEPEMRIIQKLLKNKHGIAIDIGANRGYYSEFILRKFRNLQVHSFEPQPQLYNHMKHYLCNYDRLKIYNLGISDSKSVLRLNIPNVSTENGVFIGSYLATFQNIDEDHESISIPVNTLDSFGFKNVVFIKIDVEGFEGHVLIGAKETIKNSKPIMLIEIEQRHLNRAQDSQTVSNIIDYIKDMGYDCYIIIENKLICVDELEIEKLQRHKDIGTYGYICNFFFIPENVISSG